MKKYVPYLFTEEIERDAEALLTDFSRARNVFDGRANTIWHSRWRRNKAHYPHEIQIDLGRIHKVSGFCYLPRQETAVGRIRDYEFYLSGDGNVDLVDLGLFVQVYLNCTNPNDENCEVYPP